MTNSILFSPVGVEELNSYVQKNISDNLYLFAYYNPKRYNSNLNNSTPELNFVMGILNLYSLYKDCCCFLVKGTKEDKDLLMILENYGYIDKSEKKKIFEFISIVTSFRMLIAHNICNDSSNDVYYLCKVQQFIEEKLGTCLVLSSYNDIDLLPGEWNDLLKELRKQAEEILEIFSIAFIKIHASPSPVLVIDEWKRVIIESYKSESQLKKYLFTAMENDFKMYALINKKPYHPRCSSIVNKYYGTVKQKCIETMGDTSALLNCQMKPFAFYGELLRKINISKYWEEYYSLY